MLPESGRDLRPESGAPIRGRINRLLLGAGIRPQIEAGIRPRFEAGFRRLKIDFSLSRFRRPARAGAQIIEYWRSRSDPVLGRRGRRAGSRRRRPWRAAGRCRIRNGAMREQSASIGAPGVVDALKNKVESARRPASLYVGK